jgi:hypothetical protein
MKRAVLILSIAALALPAAALGKGPSGASIDGPGGGGITFAGEGESGGTQLGNLAQHAGFFPAVFAQQPDPMLGTRPKGDLGPKYTIIWTVPGPSNEVWKLRQEFYPYAQPAPVTYMEPGQRVYDQKTSGGWFQGDSRLKEMLVSAGLPANAPAPSPAASSDASTFPTSLVGLLIVILLVVVVATAVGLRSIGRWPFPSRSTSTT